MQNNCKLFLLISRGIYKNLTCANSNSNNLITDVSFIALGQSLNNMNNLRELGMEFSWYL